MSRIDVLQQDRIRRNYAGGDLSCEELLYLLEHLVAPDSSTRAGALVDLLAAVRHCNLRAHGRGALGEALHYTVFAAGHGYHLRQLGEDVTFQISSGSSDVPFARGAGHVDSVYGAARCEVIPGSLP